MVAWIFLNTSEVIFIIPVTILTSQASAKLFLPSFQIGYMHLSLMIHFSLAIIILFEKLQFRYILRGNQKLYPLNFPLSSLWHPIQKFCSVSSFVRLYSELFRILRECDLKRESRSKSLWEYHWSRHFWSLNSYTVSDGEIFVISLILEKIWAFYLYYEESFITIKVLIPQSWP